MYNATGACREGKADWGKSEDLPVNDNTAVQELAARKWKLLMNLRQKLAFGLWLLVVGMQGQSIWRTDSLQEVVVTGTGTRHLLKDAPVQTEVITRRMLDSYGGKSLEEILAGLTASFAFSEGDMGSQMQLNGLGNNYILILIDGKRIHGDVGGENDLGLIDPQNIEKIEIVKGASSALKS